MTQPSKGILIVVVGPSGSGKDTLLSSAERYFSTNQRVQFVRRSITRPCDPKSEIHETESEASFLQRQQRGDFSIWWRANGLYYGLPSSIHKDLERGQLLIANGSRAAIDDFRLTFPSLAIVSITVSAAALATRLRNRGRESAEQIESRLQRTSQIGELSGGDVTTIDNSGERAVAMSAFIALVESHL